MTNTHNTGLANRQSVILEWDRWRCDWRFSVWILKPRAIYWSSSTSETMLRSFRSTFPRPTTSFFSQRLISGKYVEGIKCSYPIYEGQRKVDIGHVRVIQSSTWKVVVRGCRSSFLLVWTRIPRRHCQCGSMESCGLFLLLLFVQRRYCNLFTIV